LKGAAVSVLKKLRDRLKRRTLRVRSHQVSRGKKMRISVNRSLNHIYAQIIDDSKHATVLSYSSLNMTKPSGKKAEIAKQVGLELGKMALTKNITDVFFDRGGYLYHGRIKALAEGLREAGLKF
jgi:large subunit ribosomal protein L18